MTDFGADQPFAQAMDKIVEHYGIVVSESTIARITEGHAKAIFESAPPAQGWPTRVGTSTPIIVETDGGMVPIMEPNANSADKRKGKTLHWEEAKYVLHTHRAARRWHLAARSRVMLTELDNAFSIVQCKPDLALIRPFMGWVMAHPG